MPRVRNWQAISNPVPALIIWLISALTFYILFQMALRNSTPSSSTGWSLSNVERRTKLYDELSRELDVKGAAFLKNGETSQSLSLSDLFTVKNGAVTPVLRAANPPVRANVLYMSPQYSLPVAEAVQKVFMPYFDKVIWFQNSTLYHFSMFHASHHITPVTASEVEIEAEANAVKAVAKDVCPLKISLDRVVLTSTGVLLGCWQVISGLDPAVLRDRLRSALPQAPAIQLYDSAIFHTSLARLLGHPTNFPKEQKISELQFLHELVNELNRKLRGFQATISELWYVEEYDLLALALNGRVKARKFQLSCSKT
ncbi:OLC1v1012603C1 [Oldenlandia corymbosa var. corymbosa]|uniref:OLC1v1012603C1 n=1 Tax=Oldenlandia corymbosa var. corymbosa TaxID=529605 RepID=A0AAV1DW86_OLDCO|nr:OLC1v1012603C1 [Oldenlandia corymbosa var. corymbosa]